MAIKNILLHLTEDPRNKARLQAALTLASTHEAQLTALYTITPVTMPAYVAAYVPPDLLERQDKEARARAKAERAMFDAECKREGIRSEWRLAEGDPLELLGMHAYYADLVVVGQPDPEADLPPGAEDLPHQLVLTAGRPVLIVPYVGKFPKIGSRVMVAWNSSREATRAVHDALPILERAKKVIIFSVNPSKKDHIPGTDIAAHLARHGVKVEVAHTVAKDIDVGDALLGALSDRGADLLVMGAWGHSRMRELVLGGATRELLDQMTVPVLMSH